MEAVRVGVPHASTRPGERRAGGKRARIRLTVRVRAGTADAGTVLGTTGNLSWTGAFVQPSRLFPAGTPVTLFFQLRTEEVIAEGVVRWGKRIPPSLQAWCRGGMGIRFTEISPRFSFFLRDALGERDSWALGS